MGRPREPVELIIAKGNKHLTKDEIRERREREVAPCTDDLTSPSYLTAAEKKHFNKLVGQLVKIKIMGETDVETLARYVSAQTLYEKATKELRKVLNNQPKEADFENPAQYMDALSTWIGMQTALAKLQDRYFKQAQTAAASLGLTISARCKLVAPVKNEKPTANKFNRFRASGED